MKVTTLLDGTPINQRQFTRWLAALRSGEYSQAVGELQNSEGYCCLGVGCELLTVPGRLTLSQNAYLLGEVPRDQHNAPLWLKGINDDFVDRTGSQLSELNDNGIFFEPYVDDPTGGENETLTFDEIADVLEAVYVLGVLEQEEA